MILFTPQVLSKVLNLFFWEFIFRGVDADVLCFNVRTINAQKGGELHSCKAETLGFHSVQHFYVSFYFYEHIAP